MHPRGFSLVEVMAAVIVIGFMAVSIMNMYSFGGQLNNLLQENMTAANLLQYKAEEIRSQPFSKDVSGANQTITYFEKYLLSVSQITPYLGNAYLKKVHVTCTYQSAVGVSRTETLDFLVANYS